MCGCLIITSYGHRPLMFDWFKDAHLIRCVCGVWSEIQICTQIHGCVQILHTAISLKYKILFINSVLVLTILINKRSMHLCIQEMRSTSFKQWIWRGTLNFTKRKQNVFPINTLWMCLTTIYSCFNVYFFIRFLLNVYFHWGKYIAWASVTYTALIAEANLQYK